MNIKVNNNIIALEDSNQLEMLLKKLLLQEKNGIAIAVNDEVIPKSEWGYFSLKENDEVLIIEAAQGG
ncbi:MAG: sulfur carrier protein ThiS [Chitinophagales bacterium]|nr:sulfur carrier protein ThiS [Chitinophagales bacterium]